MRSPVSSGMTVAVGAILLLVLSCTRMPTAPPAEVTVTGRITGPDESPMGAVLIFLPIQRGFPRVSNFVARADSAGMYSVRLPTGRYDVVIHPVPTGFLTHVQRVEFTRSSTHFHHRFSGYVLTGMVRDPDGTVVDSGRVHVQILTPGPYSIGTTELIEGHYSLVLSEGTYVLHAESWDYWAGLSRTPSEPVSVHSDTTFDFDLGGIEVTGTVLGPSGFPMERVAVDAYGGYARNMTGSGGKYRLWLQPGNYRFRVMPWDSSHIAGRLSDPVAVQAPSSFNFDLAGVEWSGVVRWRSSGDPVPGVWVVAHGVESDDFLGAGSQTGSDGRFRLVLDPGQLYNLYAYSAGIQEIGFDRLMARTDTSFVILADPDLTARGARSPTPAPPAVRGIPSRGSSAP